jgi:predicted DNA-binding transcriptional regulator YafY
MSNNKRRFFLRYISIIQKLRTRPASFDEIQSFLKRQSKQTGEGISMSKRTFQRDLNDLRDIFHLDIKTNSANNYFISDGDDLERRSRMLETFDQLDLLYRTKNPSKYIIYEHRTSSGTENIHGILHAIYNRLQINFRHEKYWEEGFTDRTVEPLALKESHHRWYLIAKDRKDKKIKTFGLDRISNLIFDKQKFEYPKEFSADDMFYNSFGVITEGSTQNIILSFDADQKKYLGSLKIHHSQRELLNDQHEFRISLKMKITYDLIKEILSYGDAVEVLEPKLLRAELRKIAKRTLKHYSKVQ